MKKKSSFFDSIDVMHDFPYGQSHYISAPAGNSNNIKGTVTKTASGIENGRWYVDGIILSCTDGSTCYLFIEKTGKIMNTYWLLNREKQKYKNTGIGTKSFTVSGSTEDKTAPELSSVDVSGSTVTLNPSKNLSEAQIIYVADNNYMQRDWSKGSRRNLSISGATATTTIQTPGTFYVAAIILTDAAGNTSVYCGYDTDALPWSNVWDGFDLDFTKYYRFWGIDKIEKTDFNVINFTYMASWKTFFLDEFTGSTLNTTNWYIVNPTTSPTYLLTGSGSGELQIDGESGDGQDGLRLAYHSFVNKTFYKASIKLRATMFSNIDDDMDFALFLNAQSTTKYYMLLLTSDPDGASSRDYTMSIYRYDDSTANPVTELVLPKSVAGTKPQISSDTSYILEGIYNNGDITFNLKKSNGEIIDYVSATDSTYTSGTTGFDADLNLDNAYTDPYSVFIDYFKLESFE